MNTLYFHNHLPFLTTPTFPLNASTLPPFKFMSSYICIIYMYLHIYYIERDKMLEWVYMYICACVYNINTYNIFYYGYIEYIIIYVIIYYIILLVQLVKLVLYA